MIVKIQRKIYGPFMFIGEVVDNKERSLQKRGRKRELDGWFLFMFANEDASFD